MNMNSEFVIAPEAALKAIKAMSDRQYHKKPIYLDSISLSLGISAPALLPIIEYLANEGVLIVHPNPKKQAKKVLPDSVSFVYTEE